MAKTICLKDDQGQDLTLSIHTTDWHSVVEVAFQNGYNYECRYFTVEQLDTLTAALLSLSEEIKKRGNS